MNRGLAPSDRVPAAFEELVRPHVDSFDFFLTEGIHHVVEQLEPVEVGQREPRPRAPAQARRADLTLRSRPDQARRRRQLQILGGEPAHRPAPGGGEGLCRARQGQAVAPQRLQRGCEAPGWADQAPLCLPRAAWPGAGRLGRRSTGGRARAAGCEAS